MFGKMPLLMCTITGGQRKSKNQSLSLSAVCSVIYNECVKSVKRLISVRNIEIIGCLLGHFLSIISQFGIFQKGPT